MVREVGFDGCRLVGWQCEDVAEASAGIDNGLAGFLGRGDTSAWDDLRRAYRGDVGATQNLGLGCKGYRVTRDDLGLYVPGSREGWVESTRGA